MTEQLSLHFREFIGLTTKSQPMKEKFYKLGFIKIKNIYSMNVYMKRMKRHVTWKDQEKIFAKHISNTRLISGIYKELLKAQHENTTKQQQNNSN